MTHEDPWFQFRWQSLAEKSRKQWKYAHGRCWLAILSCFFRLEWHLWSDHCHINADIGGDEEQLQFSIAIPPVAVWLAVESQSGSWLRRIVPERQREIQLSMFQWSVRLILWGREGEWRRPDPWYVRGVHLDLKDAFLGKSKYTSTETAPRQPIRIAIDDRIYHGEARFERCTWNRRWWFTKVRDSVWIQMDRGHGLPHAGKGTTDYNCDDDALCGWGVNGGNVQAAIQHGLDSIAERRKKYGEPTLQGTQGQ